MTSTYNAGTGVWSASGAIANVNTLLAALSFTPTLNYNTQLHIATSVSDGVAAPVTGSKAMTGTACQRRACRHQQRRRCQRQCGDTRKHKLRDAGDRDRCGFARTNADV